MRWKRSFIVYTLCTLERGISIRCIPRDHSEGEKALSVEFPSIVQTQCRCVPATCGRAESESRAPDSTQVDSRVRVTNRVTCYIFVYGVLSSSIYTSENVPSLRLSGSNERWFDVYFNAVQVNSSGRSFCLHCSVIHVKFTLQLDVNLKKFIYK